MKQIKKIGVFISHIYGDYQNKLCEGIINKAEEYGYLVEVFTSNDGENLGDYGLGEFGILHIPKEDNYAGILFASDTYRLTTLKEEIHHLLTKNFTCPILEITQSNSKFPKIELENNHPITDLVVHLSQIHNYKQICYLGNLEQPEYSKLRYEAYLKGMNSQLLYPPTHHYYECQFSSSQISASIDYFLMNNEKVDAIVCYNDDFALSVIAKLQARGLHVPEDIAVTGCDTLEFGQNTTPSLTSITFPIKELGNLATHQLLQLIRGESIEANTIVHATAHIAESCGCTVSNKKFSLYNRTLKNRIAALEDHLIRNIHMSANLHNITDIDQGMDMLEQFFSTIPECKEIYLCLYEGWDRISKQIRLLTNTEKVSFDTNTINLKFALREGKRLPECTFIKHNCLPNYIYNKNSSYIYTPLFFGEDKFGYLALSYYNNKIGYSFSFISFLMNINGMLKNIRDHKNLGLLVGRLEDIYFKDELTGLYNPQGFQNMTAPYITNAIANNQMIMTAIYDLDCLKSINTHFGHIEGNLAIQALARALVNSMEEGLLCTRLSGDQFQVFATDYNNEKAMILLDKVQKYIDNYNRISTKNYLIKFSVGFSIRCITAKNDMSSLYDEAYKDLYLKKQIKNKSILKQEFPIIHE